MWVHVTLLWAMQYSSDSQSLLEVEESRETGGLGTRETSRKLETAAVKSRADHGKQQ